MTDYACSFFLYLTVWLLLTCVVAMVLYVRRQTALLLRYLYARQLLLEIASAQEVKIKGPFELEAHDGHKTVINTPMADGSQIILTVYPDLGFSAETWNPNALFFNHQPLVTGHFPAHKRP